MYHSLQPKRASHLSICMIHNAPFSVLINLRYFLVGIIDNVVVLQTCICNTNICSSTHQPIKPKVGGIISQSTPFLVVNFTSGGKKNQTTKTKTTSLSPLTNLHHQQTLAGSQHTEKRKLSTLNNIVRTTAFLNSFKYFF